MTSTTIAAAVRQAPRTTEPAPRRPACRPVALSAPLWLVAACGEERMKRLLEWVSEPDGLLLLPCGVTWDVVRMPEDLGLAALDRLTDDPTQETGPMLHDRTAELVYMFIDLDGGIDWAARYADVRLLSAGAHLATPSPDLPWLNTRITWAFLPPTPQPTGPARLAAALDALAGGRTTA
ncbi:hypothetical protein [Kitasatospora sp. NPDC059599]|uniref:hypothetical protein n=1 Tax=Kitasatospora sp. NPDC059599 TaxID=3346880 RepID=UPI003688DD3D